VYKFGQLIIRKVIEIVATRCKILWLNAPKFDFGWDFPQTLLENLRSLHRSKRPFSWLQGATSNGGRERRGREMREW